MRDIPSPGSDCLDVRVQHAVGGSDHAPVPAGLFFFPVVNWCVPGFSWLSQGWHVTMDMA